MKMPGDHVDAARREDEKFEGIDAIKLDVEGAEDLILEPFFRDVRL